MNKTQKHLLLDLNRDSPIFLFNNLPLAKFSPHGSWERTESQKVGKRTAKERKAQPRRCLFRAVEGHGFRIKQKSPAYSWRKYGPTVICEAVSGGSSGGEVKAEDFLSFSSVLENSCLISSSPVVNWSLVLIN